MIFLSYTWRNQAIAHEVDVQLRLAGFAVWIDHRNLRPDADILAQLGEAIRHCELFVTVKPDNHVGSLWMRTELSIARAYGKRIVPFMANPSAFAAQMTAASRHNTLAEHAMADAPTI
jgi:TIR domain